MNKKDLLGVALVIAAIATATNLSAADGKQIYAKECARCHGADGKGQTKMGKKLGAKDYTNPKVQAEITDDQAIKAVKEGFKDKAGKTMMKPDEDLSDAEIKAVVAYMRAFKN